MDWSFYGPVAAIVGFFLLVLGQKIGYSEGRRDERQEQERHRAAMQEVSEPLDELDEARERQLQAMLQVAADAWEQPT